MLALEINPIVKLQPLDHIHIGPLLELIDQNRDFLQKNLSWLEAQTRREDVAHFISHYQKLMSSKRGIMFGIFHKKMLIGNIGLFDIDPHNKNGQISIWISQEYQNQGIAENAMQQVIKFAFMDWKLNRLEIRCKADNEPTAKLASKLGFNLEGKLRQSEWYYDHFEDLVVFGLLGHEVRAKRA
ncbi:MULTISPECIES: GNAT family N-acetyltransferase [Persicobacter]|uniref:N-acetyltransferase domain-containing protein n=1 Tax=Persicobacter diffluens TaxID=981 RepID=A0AAN4VYT8_9BACT|nr:GNAT family protein [Persicobacter sp. CCB-QB2]GJM61305.1 hypothetical protein PEDI_18570 [Persicobacter diffluens]